jgi:hypothetical protein
MKLSQILEAKDLFPEIDVIKLDPDRADAYDVVSHVMPTLVRMAYADMVHDKAKYDRTFDEEDDKPYEFTADTLEDKLDDLIKLVREKFEDLSMHDRLSYIDKMKSEFKPPLEKK